LAKRNSSTIQNFSGHFVDLASACGIVTAARIMLHTQFNDWPFEGASMRRLLTIAVSIVILSVSAVVSAQTTLTADITNAQEGNVGTPPAPVTPTTTTGQPRSSSGQATFVISPAMDSITFTATVTGIDFTGTQSADTNDNLSAAHIHISDSPTFTPPATAGVRWGFFGQPFNDNNPNDQVVTPLATGVGGTISGKWDAPEGNNTTLAPWIDDILAGRAYINFHTTQYPGGEIRGALVPEPSTITLLGLGGAALAIAFRRRQFRRAQ
jgi:hypothetical protein